MLKVGIELPDENIFNVDLSSPELGNPGVGGSEYLFILLANELKKHSIDITVYHYSHNLLNNDLVDCIVKDNIEMIHKANEDNIDILIHQVGKSEDWYKNLSNTNIHSVAWAHVYLDYMELQFLKKCNNVKRIVFVGKEEYDSYIDDDIIKKSTYIYNMVPTLIPACERAYQKPIVTYVGSLVPQKGFHKLAEIWPDIVKEVPDAQLNVIGTGKVYNRNAKLGKYGIAESDYENQFMQFFLNDDDTIMSSVNFLGIVGSNKTEIFKNTMVGIVNPTALTETFCLSAVEMEYSYVPVISKRKWGLLDTIKNNKTGFLFRNRKEFTNKVVCLLKNKELNDKLGLNAHNFVKQTFSVDVIIPEWIKLINDVYENSFVQYYHVQGNWYNDYKWMKQIIRFFRINLKLSMLPSFHDIKEMLKKLLKKKKV